MAKQSLMKFGLLIALVSGGWYLFAPQPLPAPEVESTPASDTTEQTAATPSRVETLDDDTEISDEQSADDIRPGTIILTGTFMGLIESEPDQDRRTFQYLLLNDGTEMIRIDLRPLVGRSDIDIEEKLGVSRGELIKVEGYIEETNGRFIPEVVRYHNDVIEAQ